MILAKCVGLQIGTRVTVQKINFEEVLICVFS